MNRQERIQRAQVVTAWSEGRAVQFSNCGGPWTDATDAIAPCKQGFFEPHLEWRIKPEKKLIPWTAETFPKDRPVWVREKLDPNVGNWRLIDWFGAAGAASGQVSWTWECLLVHCVQHDGSPCGVEVKP